MAIPKMSDESQPIDINHAVLMSVFVRQWQGIFTGIAAKPFIGCTNELARLRVGLVRKPKKVIAMRAFILTGNSCRVTPGVGEALNFHSRRTQA